MTQTEQRTIMATTDDPFALTGPADVEFIVHEIRRIIRTVLRRQGAVVAVSGGIDSAVCAALCTRAMGPDRVLALSLPERHSSVESKTLADELCAHLGIPMLRVSIDPVLETAGCYRSQVESLRSVHPGYQEGDSFKITLPSILEGERLNLPRLTVRPSGGEEVTMRIPGGPYLQLVASTNFKQRSRTMTAYYHADRLNYAVCGTPNRLEYDQGFFVKGGDGLSDVAPIAHLYKSQVFKVGALLGVPAGILNRVPTTDTFPMEQTQEEFYFAAPYRTMDICLFGVNQGLPPASVAARTGLSEAQVARIYVDIEAKRKATFPLHLPSLTLATVVPVEDRILALLGRAGS
jgi:NAD+ synthase